MSSTGKYPITGIKTKDPSGLLPTRKRFNDWWDKNELQVSLFIRALTKLGEKPIDERISYFQIAGIHCYPTNVGWDNEGGKRQPTEDDSGGYCAHNQITFPTWHRPYMALYEQALYDTMISIVDGIENTDLRKQWKEAADNFRLPYWDWAQTPDLPTQFCDMPTLEIKAIQGSGTDKFDNPLYKFINPKKGADGKAVAFGDASMGIYKIPDNGNKLPWSKCIGTSRYGMIGTSEKDVEEWKHGRNYYKRANEALNSPSWYNQGGTSSLKDAVGRLLTDDYLPKYYNFSTTKYNPPDDDSNKNYFSLEYIHNVVHNIAGGSEIHGSGLGHMSDVPVAAFDPVFWLHHCNIDRLFAIWQRLNPKAQFSGPEVTIPENQDPKATDYLAPFHYNTEEKDEWNSERCWEYTNLHYDYDDIAGKSEAQLRQYVKDTYPTSSTAVFNSPNIFSRQTPIYDDYIINVIYDRYALNGRSYSILFFITDVPSPLGDYRHSQSFLGEVYTFSAPLLSDGKTACDNCAKQQQGSILSGAHIPITLPLLQMVQTEGHPLAPGAWNPEVLSEFLKRNLKVVFVEIGGRERDPIDFPRTTYAVLRGQATFLEPANEMPRFVNYTVLKDVTKDKPLGYSNFLTRESGELDDLISDDPHVDL